MARPNHDIAAAIDQIRSDTAAEFEIGLNAEPQGQIVHEWKNLADITQIQAVTILFCILPPAPTLYIVYSAGTFGAAMRRRLRRKAQWEIENAASIANRGEI